MHGHIIKCMHAYVYTHDSGPGAGCKQHGSRLHLIIILGAYSGSAGLQSSSMSRLGLRYVLGLTPGAQGLC